MKRLTDNARGFTLIELMITLAVAGVLLGIAVPAFNGAMERNRLTNYSNELLGALIYARNEARNRNTDIQVCNLAPPQNAGDPDTCANNWDASLPLVLLQTDNNTVLRNISPPPGGSNLSVQAITFAWDNVNQQLNGALQAGQGTNITYDDDGHLSPNANGTRARRLCIGLGGNEVPFTLFQSGQVQIQPEASC